MSSVVYTHRGFPTLMAFAAPPESVYESPEVSDIYRERAEQVRPSLEVELSQIAIMTAEWCRTQGFFAAVLNPTVRVSANVQSFIVETALYLTKEITRRRVSFQDRALLIKQDSSASNRLPTFQPHERQVIEELSQLTPDALIQMWVSRLGVDDLSQTFQLYVGDRTFNSVQ